MANTLQCNQCSSTDLSEEDNGVFVCHYCGARTVTDGRTSSAREYHQSSQKAKTGSQQKSAGKLTMIPFLVVGATVLVGLLVAFWPTSGGPSSSSQKEPQATASGTIDSSSAAKNTSAEIVNDVMVRNKVGSVYVYGMIKNTGETILNMPKALITFYDKNDKVLEEDYTYGEISYVYPGQVNPFRVINTTVKEAAVRYTVKAEIKPYTYGSPPGTPKIKILDPQLTPGERSYYILKATVKNVDDVAASFVKLIGFLKDENGKFLDMETRYSGRDIIQPDESALITLKFNLWGLKGKPSGYELYYSAQEAND